jgi:hypothetical protein
LTSAGWPSVCICRKIGRGTCKCQRNTGVPGGGLRMATSSSTRRRHGMYLPTVACSLR